MKVLISLPSPREFKNILATPFFDLIKNDGNKYLFVTHSAHLKNIIEPRAHNVKCVLYKTPNNFQRLLYWCFLDRVYETSSLRSGVSTDRSIFYNRLKRFNKVKYVLGLISYLFYKILGGFLFQRVERFIYHNKFYEGLDVDKVLVTNYHSLHEKMIYFSLRDRPLYFFADGWDAFTKQTFYSQFPDVFLLWSDSMKTMLEKNCGVNNNACKTHIVGNPFWDTLPGSRVKNNTALFFSNNQWVYNEEDILQSIHGNVSSSVRFSIRLPPTTAYHKRRHRYLTRFPNFIINELDIDFWLDYNFSRDCLFDYSYTADLESNNIFIFTGPSTAMLDVIKMGGYVIMLCIEDMLTDGTLWDYRLTCDREVLRGVSNYDKFRRFSRVEDLLAFINTFSEDTNPRNRCETSYSSQLYNAIDERY